MFSSYSIKSKLSGTVVLTTFLALFIANGILLTQDYIATKKEFKAELSTQGKVLSEHITAALLFDDSDSGNDILSAIKHNPSIISAEVFGQNNAVFVHYHNREYDEILSEDVHQTAAHHVNKNLIVSEHSVIYNGEPIGKVVIYASNEKIIANLRHFILVSIAVTLLALFLAVLISQRLQRFIYQPIEQLAQTAKEVSAHKNYKIRAKIFSQDELGKFSGVFNDMLDHIQERDDKLESTVHQRTLELHQKNEELEAEVYERTQAENRLKESDVRFRGAFDNAAIGMALVAKDHSIYQVNQALTNILGYTEAQLIGTQFKFLTHNDDILTSIEKHQMLVKGDISHYQLEKRYLHKNGDIIWGLLNVSSIRDSDDQFLYAIAQIQDITEAHELSEQLSYQATHDSLTDLVNRREFERRLHSELQSIALGSKTEHALCYIDLDQFKVINDTCGHVAGDELLRQLASSMKTILRKRDLLARLGGDEFGVLMEDCSLEQAKRVATLICTTVEEFRFSWEDKTFNLGASIGLTTINQHSSNVVEVMKRADAACYVAKELGRNRIHVYLEEDTSLAQRHGEMQWVSKINAALDDNRFRVYAQPILNLETAQINHYELLLRMEDETGAIIPPGAFLPAAERYNLISKIDKWMLDTAFRWLENESRHVPDLAFCSLNLSGLTLGDNHFLDHVLQMIEQAHFPTNRICFEITETAANAHLNNAMTFINALKDKGCLFALDDFGSGVSSFAYLKNLPVDYLKIDGMFVKDMVDDPIDFAMVKSINEIGQVMGKKTIAEFVENDAIQEKLMEIGVNYAQGYGVGKPVPLETITTGSVEIS